MPTLLLDENIDGCSEYLSRFVFSAAWNDISSSLDLRIVTFADVGLDKGTPDERVWEFCQERLFYLITDNRNEEGPDSLGTMIRTRNEPTSLPVFTMSDIQRLRSEREYVESLVTSLLEYLIDADRLRGTGRLYLP